MQLIEQNLRYLDFMIKQTHYHKIHLKTLGNFQTTILPLKNVKIYCFK